MNIMQLKAFVEQHDPWSARVFGTVAQNLNNGSFSFPEMTAIDFDPSNMVTTGVGGYITIPVDGIYFVGCAGVVNNASDGTLLIVSIFKNGSEFHRGTANANGAATPIVGSCHAVMYLQAGDQIKMGQYTATAGMQTAAASPYLFCSVAYLCAA